MNIRPPKNFFNRRDMLALFKMLLPFFFIVVTTTLYYDFVIHAIKGHLVVNVAIILTVSYGITLIIVRLLGAQGDMRALDRFSEEALAGTNMKELLDQPWLKNRSIQQYLEPIAQTEGTLASQLDQNAIESELHALAEDYNSKLELPQFLVGFMIALGLLGTFIGLLETLTGISGMLDGMGHSGEDITAQFTKLVSELRKPLAGMGMAFSASMFGLITSLILSIMMIMMRRYVSLIMAKARSVMHDLTTRVAVPLPSMARMHDGGFYREDGSTAHTSSSAMQMEVEMFTSKISELMVRSENRATMLSDEMNQLVKRLDFIFAFSEKAMKEGKTTEGEGSVMSTHLLAAVREVGAIGTAQKETMQKVVESLTELDQKFGVMLAGSGDQKAHYESMVALTKGTSIKIEEVVASLRAIGDSTSTLAPALDRKLSPVVNNARESVVAQQQTTSKLGEIYNADMDMSRHLMEIKENFMKVAPFLEMVGPLVDNTSQQTLLLEASLDEYRNTQKMLVSTLQRELQSFTKTLAQAMGITIAPTSET